MKIRTKEGSWLHHYLTEHIIQETDVYFAERSRLTCRPCETHSNCYVLTPLGVLNGLFGVELQLLPALDSSTEDGPTSPT